MHEIHRCVLVSIPPIFGIDLSITNEVVLVWVAAAITFVTLWLACRRSGVVARGAFQNFFEALVEFVEKDIVRANMGDRGRSWGPFLLTLFFFVLFGNLLGLVPAPDFVKAATASISVTGGLAVMVFLLTVYVNVRTHGVLGFFKKFAPGGVPKAILPLVIPIEIVSWLAKPASLAIRLFANLVSGHALVFVFIGMASTVFWFLKPLPYIGAVVMVGFELFVSFIQAFIFAMLAGIYINEALDTAH